ncbi:hypothetical protein [Costertonia aggregata]|uniref:Uncharacterized protein n=1 Tax=Costertonia aggregata TaxID=343403 RepID=A0A7H9AR86_9FLAO|nr:hypothetical protein [Costertonia aggregata]QLG46001.1 hypothetical protein HYG79_11810 [Costertonia aggregata]
MIIFSIISTLMMIGLLSAFAFILSKGIEYYNFKAYALNPIFFIGFVYGFLVFLAVCFIKSKKMMSILMCLVFTTLYLFMTFQVAFDLRSEFGATWLSSEVFWELVVNKGKGLYFLAVGLILTLISTMILVKK